MKWLGIFACVLCAALSFCDCPAWAQGGTQYVVTARITPLFETVKDVKAAPGGKWKDIPDGFLLGHESGGQRAVLYE